MAIEFHLLLVGGWRMTRDDIDPDAALGWKQFLPNGRFRIFFSHFHHQMFLLLLPATFPYAIFDGVALILPNQVV